MKTKHRILFIRFVCHLVAAALLLSFLPVYATEGTVADETSTEQTETAPAPAGSCPFCLSKVVGDYCVTVSAGENAELPENTALAVFLLSPADDGYDTYVSDSADAAGFSGDAIGAALVFDISLVDEDGAELTPSVPVQVQISLLSSMLENEVAVVHVAHDEATDEQTFDVLDAAADANSVEFETDSFSVFVIIDGPPPISTEYVTAQELSELPGDGFYLSITRGGKVYYFRDYINNKNCIARTGDGDIEAAALWYFEPADTDGDYYLYTVVDGQKLYMEVLSSLFMNLSPDNKTAFTVSLFTDGVPGVFYIKVSGTASTGLNYSGGNDSFKCYGTKNNDCKVVLTYPLISEDDPWHLDGAEYAILYYDEESLYANALCPASSTENCLDSLSAPVREDPLGSDDTLVVAEDGGAVTWQLHAAGGDRYTISATSGGSTAYVSMSGTSLSMTDASAATAFQLVPGSGNRAGRFKLVSNGVALSYDRNKKAFTGSTAGTARDWLSFAVPSGLTNADFVTYTAQKVSASDPVNLTNGSRVIVYTRVWNSADKRYDFYIVDHNGRLFRCYEYGDTIRWIGTQLNTAIWDFTEYYYEGTNTPNYYYELRNEYSGKFIAPQIGGGVLSDSVIGLTMTGRRDGSYYTPILAWDEGYYAYAALKTAAGSAASGYLSEATDFYFALIQHADEFAPLDTVETIDNEQHGITMKLVNFGNRASDIINVSGPVIDDKGRVITSKNPTSREQYDVIGPSVYDAYRPTQGLLSSSLGPDGYPVALETGRSFSELYGSAVTVNHLFNESIYEGSGYYEFDSAQNYATLTETGDFRVYKGLGTVDNSSKPSLRHGQFLPYNDISSAYMASINPENLYDAVLNELPNEDPRKHERLFLVQRPDYFFGMEIEAQFVQTPNGQDRWGHDIVYEFTGDDDFWLYVDGELVIDLGGIHSAYPGKVNFCTGEIVVNGVQTTLIQAFRSNYAAREGLSENDPLVDAYLETIFEQNDSGQYVFKDYSTHTMRIFYMERGGGASNLHMRFNLAAVKEGQVLLSKELSGLSSDDYYMSEYAFQIYYSIPGESAFRLLPAILDGNATVSKVNSSAPVHYEEQYSPSGSSLVYNNVFFLQAGETAAISLPDEAIQYYIVECGVNAEVYDAVRVNDSPVSGLPTSDELRLDYPIPPAAMSDRPRVNYDNHISENALRTLSITKRIFAADGVTPIQDPEATFNFRLYLGAEGSAALAPAPLKAYSVKDSAGYYCTWDYETQSFIPTAYANWSLMPSELREYATFHTSPNGAISKIPAGCHVEVRGLVVGTRFRVEERDNEIPPGYAFLRYERDADSYIVESGDTVNSGTIRAGQSPALEIHNKQVWDLRLTKIWSDADYVDSHGDLFFGVVLDGALVPGTVRVLSHPDTELLYRFEALAPGASFSDYAVRELAVSGSYTVDEAGYLSGDFTAAVIEAGEALSVVYRAQGASEDSTGTYTVRYDVGVPDGVFGNVRNDTVTNSRKGIRIVKTDVNGTPLHGAAFTLFDSSGALVGSTEYVSGDDGLVTVAYLASGETYTLTETRSPAGYQAPPVPITFTVTASGVSVLSGETWSWSVDNSGDEPCLTVKNKPFSFSLRKIDANGNAPLSDAVFSLYAEVTVDGQTRMDYFPLNGYTDLRSDSSGTVPMIDETLIPGTYYLVETSAPGGYAPLSAPVRFSVSGTGVITLSGNDAAELNVAADSASVRYVLLVKNGEVSVVPGTGFDLPMTGGTGFDFLSAFLFLCGAIVCAFVLRSRKRRGAQ